MTELALLLLTVAGLTAMLDWRNGLIACIAVGVLQDPFRKLAPGQPIYYVVFVAFIFAITAVRAHLARVPLAPAKILGWKRHLRLPFSLFLFLVFAQAFHSIVAYKNYLLVGVGLLVWLSPLPAVLLAHQYAIRRGLRGVRRVFFVYVCFAMAGLAGVYLQYAGYESRLLGEVGEGVLIYDLGTAFKGHSGFFRATEIAAWHTAAVASFVFMLFVGKRTTPARIVLALALIGVLATLGVLTGRRKMLVEITLFIGTYFFLVAWLQKGAARLAMGVLAIAFMAYVGIVGFVAPDLVDRSHTKSMYVENPTALEGYATRGVSVFRDVPGRFSELGVQAISWAIANNGWLGTGLGTGSQGTQHVLEEHNVSIGAAEGGLGKIVTELGVPGLFLIAWLLRAVIRHVMGVLRYLTDEAPQYARLGYGLAAFLVANSGVYVVATQAFNDPFILLLLGWSAGFLISLPEVVQRDRAAAQRLAQRRQMEFAWAPTWGSLPSVDVTGRDLRR